MSFKAILFFFIVLVFSVISYSQSVMEFVDVKDAGDLKTVYFQVKGLGSDENARIDLLNDLLSDPNIEKGRIFTSSSLKTRCQLFIPYSIEPEYIRPLLQANGYDFEFSSVTIDGQLLANKQERTFVSIFYPPDPDFPQIELTGDKEQDAVNYKLAKEEWIESNKRKYNRKKAKGTADYPIIISQEQFDNFTEEKKQKILEQPETFEIR